MTSATDELRRLLDERGVEYGGSDAVVYFEDERGYKACAYDAPRRYGECVLCVSHTATPEQAIAATLGQGTCHNKGYVYCSERYFVCSSCGCEFDYSNFACEFAEHRSLGSPHYCPNCGRKVVDDG